MKIKPLHNNIVIKQDEVQEQTYGSIVVADLGKEKPLQGKVVAIGPGTYSFSGEFIKPSVYISVGDTVIFPSFGGTRITVDGEEYIVCKDTDLIAVLKND